MRPVDRAMVDLSFLMRMDFCLAYFIVSLAGVSWGIKKKSPLLAVVAATAGIIFALMIVAGILLVNGIS